MIEKIEKLRETLKRFYYGYYTIIAHYMSGTKQNLQLQQVYKDFHDLYSPEQIAWINQPFNELKLLKGNIEFLRAGLNIQYLDSMAADEFVELQHALDSKSISQNTLAEMLRTLLISEEKHARSATMHLIEEKIYSLLPLYEHLWKRWQYVPAETNCSKLSESILSCYPHCVEEATKIAEYFLAVTDSQYSLQINKFCELNGTTLDNLQYADLLYYLGNPICNEYLLSGSGLKCLQECLENLKISFLMDNLEISIPSGRQSLRGDIENGIYPILPSELIQIFVLPTIGFDFYRRLFNAFGRAALYAAVPDMIPIEYVYFGDTAYDYGYGYLFELMLENEYFWKYYISSKDIQHTIQVIKLSRFISLRHLAALALFENKIIENPSTKPLANLTNEYKSLMKEALRIDVPASFYLIGRDLRLKAIQSLRGFSFASLFRHRLIAKYGNEWFRNKKAGYEIMELLECGKQHPIKEVIQDWGFTSLVSDPSLLVEI